MAIFRDRRAHALHLRIQVIQVMHSNARKQRYLGRSKFELAIWLTIMAPPSFEAAKESPELPHPVFTMRRPIMM